MRYIAETTDKGLEIAVYTPGATERDHVAVTVTHPMAADHIIGMLNSSFAVGKAGRPLDPAVIADSMATLLAPWGSAVSDRGLRAEVADAHQAGLAARDTAVAAAAPSKGQAA